MRVLIVSKTRMAHAACVGAIDMVSRRSLRLLDSSGHNQPQDSNYEVGEVWDIDYIPKPNSSAPHVEDVLVQRRQYVEKHTDLLRYILDSGFPIWRGGPETLFDGKLHFSNAGSSYAAGPEFPSKSTGFWMPDRALVRNDFDKDKPRFCYRENPNSFTGQHCLPYVGYADPLADRIPANTLLRVSLARPYRGTKGDEDPKCWLQLSGWYLNGQNNPPSQPVRTPTRPLPLASDDDNDLPF